MSEHTTVSAFIRSPPRQLDIPFLNGYTETLYRHWKKGQCQQGQSVERSQFPRGNVVFRDASIVARIVENMSPYDCSLISELTLITREGVEEKMKRVLNIADFLIRHGFFTWTEAREILSLQAKTHMILGGLSAISLLNHEDPMENLILDFIIGTRNIWKLCSYLEENTDYVFHRMDHQPDSLAAALHFDNQFSPEMEPRRAQAIIMFKHVSKGKRIRVTVSSCPSVLSVFLEYTTARMAFVTPTFGTVLYPRTTLTDRLSVVCERQSAKDQLSLQPYM